MATITPSTPENGGTIRLLYAPGATRGVSNKITIEVTIAINPSNIVPDVILSLELPGDESHFQFDNTSLITVKDFGPLNNGTTVRYDFIIICNKVDPAQDLRIRISTRDKEESDSHARFTSVDYTIEKIMTTANRVKAAFLR